jgi:hypothetical protein
MKLFQNLYLPLILIGLLTSCEKEKEIIIDCGGLTVYDSSLTFGYFNGECIGVDCIATYKLGIDQLFEDTLDSYAGSGPFEFILRPQEDYLLVNDLIDYYPNELLLLPDSVFGCPDCIDQGGLFIMLDTENVTSTFIIDQNQFAVPSYLHPFVDKVNEYTELLTD